MGDWLFGSSDPEPTVTTSTQTNELPEELKEPYRQITSEASRLYDEEKAAGYTPYEGPRLAAFDPATTRGLEGTEALVSRGLSSDPTLASARSYFAPAYGLGLTAAQQWTPQTATQYMSPYMQSVVDIQKREAERRGDVAEQQLAGQATMGAGSFGGSRQAILEAEHARNEAQLMDDIQRRGLQEAYTQGLGAFQAQKQREAGLAPVLAQMGTAAAGQAAQEQQQLAGVGSARQAQTQRGLDIDYQKFLQEKDFPYSALTRYSDYIRGVSRPGSATTIQTGQQPTPSIASQAVGLGMTGAGIANAFGLFKKKGGKVGRAEGGAVVKRNASGSVNRGLQGIVTTPRQTSYLDWLGGAKSRAEDSQKAGLGRWAEAMPWFQAASRMMNARNLAQGLTAGGLGWAEGMGELEDKRTKLQSAVDEAEGASLKEQAALEREANKEKVDLYKFNRKAAFEEGKHKTEEERMQQFHKDEMRLKELEHKMKKAQGNEKLRLEKEALRLKGRMDGIKAVVDLQDMATRKQAQKLAEEKHKAEAPQREADVKATEALAAARNAQAKASPVEAAAAKTRADAILLKAENEAKASGAIGSTELTDIRSAASRDVVLSNLPGGPALGAAVGLRAYLAAEGSNAERLLAAKDAIASFAQRNKKKEEKEEKEDPDVEAKGGAGGFGPATPRGFSGKTQ